MTSSPVWRIDTGEIAGWLTPTVRAALPLAIAEASAHLAPSRGADFKRHVLPTLVLVSPSGWSQEQSAAWQAAAIQELSGIPADLLTIGAAAARKVADHPSKIIPAIHAAIGASWSARRNALARLKLIDDVAAGRRQRMPWEPETFDPADTADPAEVAALLDGIGIATPKRRSAQPGPLRKPTDADYIAMGLTPEALQRARENERAEKAAKAGGQASAAPTTPCPACGQLHTHTADGYGVCEAVGCGEMWRIDQAA